MTHCQPWCIARLREQKSCEFRVTRNNWKLCVVGLFQSFGVRSSGTGCPSETNFHPFEENCLSPFEQLELSVQNNCQSLYFATETGLYKGYQPRYRLCIQYQHFSFGKMSLNQDLENLSTWLPQITCPSVERKPNDDPGLLLSWTSSSYWWLCYRNKWLPEYTWSSYRR